MKNFLKIFLILLVLLVIGLGVFLWTFDLNTYRGYIENKISTALGRPVKIDSLDMKLSLIPTIKAKNIQVGSNEKTFSDKNLIEADTAEITLSLLPLLSRRLEVQNIALNTVNVNLISKNGRTNWRQDTTRTGSISNDKGMSEIRLDTLSILKLSLSYQDDDSVKTYVGQNFSLKQMKVFSLSADVNSIPFKISGTVDNLLDFISEKPDYLFNIEIDGAGLLAKFSGSIGNTRTFKNLLLNADISGVSLKGTLESFNCLSKFYPAQPFNISTVMQGDLGELNISKMDFSIGNNKVKGTFTGLISGIKKQPTLALVGNVALSDATLSHFWGVNPFTADLDFVLNQEVLTLNNFSLRANRTDLQLMGKIAQNSDKLKADLRIESEFFDTQDFFFSEDMFYIPELDPYAQTDRKTLIEDKPIDISFLNKLDAEITIQMPHLKVSDNLRNYLGINSSFIIKDGVLSVNPLNITILGSKATGELIVSAIDNAYYLKLAGEDFQLNDLRHFSKILQNATTDIALDLTAHGQSVKELLSSLNGQFLLDMSDGLIVSDWFNDLAENLNNKKKLSVSYSTTDYESKIICSALKANIKDGKITAENSVAIETSKINFMIGGNIDLNTETVDLTMIPSLNIADQKLGNILKTLGRFIKITGTFTDLKPAINLENAIPNILRIFDNTPYAEYQMCQQVLGRPTKAQQLKAAKQLQIIPTLVVPQPVSEPKKDTSFKRLLMDSLEEVLQ